MIAVGAARGGALRRLSDRQRRREGRPGSGILKAIVAPRKPPRSPRCPTVPAKALVTERCLLCHGAALITQQRKDAAAWGRTVTQMRTWGTPIQDEDQTALVAYLAEHFGPRAVRR